jgi:hypothetical protein
MNQTHTVDGGHLGRRGFLTGLALTGVAALAGTTQAQAEPDTGWRGGTSANGWPVLGPAAAISCHVEGSAAVVALRPGDVATVLTYVLRRFHYEVHTLAAGDLIGHSVNRSLSWAPESNHLSGTAVAIRPGQYPLGVRDAFHPAEVAVIRDVLADCDGVVRWGADDPRTSKAGHFQIDVRPGAPALRKLAVALSGRTAPAGRGAGGMPDPFAPERRQRAREVEREHRPR